MSELIWFYVLWEKIDNSEKIAIPSTSSTESHRFCDRVQDAYTLRCCPQVNKQKAFSFFPDSGRGEKKKR